MDKMLLNRKKVLYWQTGSEGKKKKKHNRESIRSSDENLNTRLVSVLPKEKFLSKQRERSFVHILQIFVQILNSYPFINATKFTSFHKQLPNTDFKIHIL